MSSGTWSSGPALAVPHAGHRAALLSTGDVLIAGGNTDIAEKLSSRTSSFSSAGRLLSPVSEHTLNALNNGAAILIGGSQPQLYNPNVNDWVPSRGDGGVVRRGHTATRMKDGPLLIVGDTVPSTEIYDPASDTFTRAAPTSTHHHGHTGTLLNDGRVLIAGGNIASESLQLTAEIHTPTWETWAFGPNLIAPRRGHTETLLGNGRVLMAGGTDTFDGQPLSLTEEFDPSALASTISEYKLPASVNGEVLDDRTTELWAAVARPAKLEPGKRYPLLLFLHGNHATCGTGENPREDFSCEYTDSGVCSNGSVVVPSHRGYDYVASELVSDLEGVRPFDRMIGMASEAQPTFKSTYTVWGANHNFFNTEWQVSDSGGCTAHQPIFSVTSFFDGSAEQRQMGLRSMLSFFLANVGASADPSLDELFDPAHSAFFESRVERGYTPGIGATVSRVLEDFKGRTGISTYEQKNLHSHITITHANVPEHDPSLVGASIAWTSGGANTFFQTNFSAPGTGFDLSSYGALDFRIGRAQDPLNVPASTVVDVQLVGSDDALSNSVPTSDFVDLVGPVGGPYFNYHEMLSTVRLPLSYFSGVDLTRVRGVRFTFQRTPSGAVYLANVRATRLDGNVERTPATFARAATASTTAPPSVVAGVRPANVSRRVTTGNSVESLRTTSDGQSIRIALSSSTPFLARDDLLVLDVGPTQSIVASHPKGDLRKVVFTVPKAAFDSLTGGLVSSCAEVKTAQALFAEFRIRLTPKRPTRHL